MKKILLILFIIATLLSGCGNNTVKKPMGELLTPPYTDGIVYNKQPIHTVPLGYYDVIMDIESEVEGSIFVGVDTAIIPVMTHLYIQDLGLRIAVADKKASGKTIVVYDNIDDNKLFIWGIIETSNKNKTPIIIKI